MPKILDPDLLRRNTEIVYDFSNPSARTIQLAQTGNLDADGATLQAIFSAIKDHWRNNNDLIKVPFPFGSDGAIFEEKFDLKNAWNWADTTTRNLIRDGGWSVRGPNNELLEAWTGVVTLGTLGATDQVYYQQQMGGATTNIVRQGPVNQAVQTFRANPGGFDFRSFLRLLVRVQGKTYSEALLTDVGLTSLDYRRIAFPLANALDPKVSASDNTINSQAPYTGMSITYLAGVGFTAWAAGQSYAQNAVTQFNGRWFRATSAHTSNTNNDPGDAGAPWVAYEGERQVGSQWFAYNVVINGNNGTAEQIYEFAQRQLRQATDIDAGTGTVVGRTADLLLRFVGDNLITFSGVFVDQYRTADINRITFTDISGVARTFPYTAAGTIQFSDSLRTDAQARYWLFFKDLPGTADYGTAGAIAVNDASGNAIAGLVNGQASVAFTFAYDSNNQGGRTAGTDAVVVGVAIGSSGATFFSTEATIARSTSNVIPMLAGQERNYLVGSVA